MRRLLDAPGEFPGALDTLVEARHLPELSGEALAVAMKEHLLRSTLINLYIRCPRAYKLRVSGKLPDPPNKWGQLGNAAHLLAGGLLLEEDGAKLEKRVVSELPLELAADWPAVSEAVRTAVAKIRRETLVGVEETLTWAYVYKRRHYLVRGTIDALEIADDFATITDWKTGWGVPNQDELEADPQLLIYAVLVARQHPQVQRFRLQQVQFRFGSRTPWIQLDRAQVEAWAKSLQETGHRMIADRKYEPNPLCDVCPPGVHLTKIQPYRSWDVQLEKGAFKVTLPPITDDVSAQAVAAATRFAEALARAGRAKMREWAFAHGPIVVGAGAYGHFYQADVRPKDLAEIVKKLSPDEQREYLRIDGTKRPALLRARPELAGEFDEDGTTKFDYRLAKKEALS